MTKFKIYYSVQFTKKGHPTKWWNMCCDKSECKNLGKLESTPLKVFATPEGAKKYASVRSKELKERYKKEVDRVRIVPAREDHLVAKNIQFILVNE